MVSLANETGYIIIGITLCVEVFVVCINTSYVSRMQRSYIKAMCLLYAFICTL